MDADLEKLFEDKMKVILNLIRATSMNNPADEVMKITQAACNLAQARNIFAVNIDSEVTPKKRPGASAS